jgi:HAMP domain-containing protein
MSDPNEIAALQAAVRGAVSTTDALAGLRERIEALDPHADIGAEMLDEIGRVAAAHALASAALRGLVDTMKRRRADAP